jgi:hypothetical protein
VCSTTKDEVPSATDRKLYKMRRPPPSSRVRHQVDVSRERRQEQFILFRVALAPLGHCTV